MFVDGNTQPKKKEWETASLRLALEAKFPGFFFRVNILSTKQMNLFLIISLYPNVNIL
jgi:hypothetical protein